jgi:hypothetical protein
MTRVLLAIASWLVPAENRSHWQREWFGELHAAVREGRRTRRLAFGAMADAWAVRHVSRSALRPEPGQREREEESMTAAGALRELIWAARRLVKARGFTAASVLTLARECHPSSTPAVSGR